tara:strand:+ start:2014 stop:2322 length:309 start_codon:yes stop_codon:yes gene_type:complete
MTSLHVVEAFVSGILWSTMVYLAVWLRFAGHTVIEKVVAIVFSIPAFVAMGLEHSVANMLLPVTCAIPRLASGCWRDRWKSRGGDPRLSDWPLPLGRDRSPA